MPRIGIDNITLSCDRRETLLDAMIASGIDYPYSCKTGECQICLARCLKGMVPESSRQGLSAKQQNEGYFLTCQCHPETDMSIQRPQQAAMFGRAVVVKKQLLSPEICRLCLESSTPLYYHAGQFINLRRGDGCERSYALASIPQQNHLLELHIQHKRGGQFSQWVFNEVKEGYGLDYQGPNGDCYYRSDFRESDILLVAEDAGLAALIGVVRDALHNDHHGGLYLYHGSQRIDNLYLQQEIRALQCQYSHFHYIPCLGQREGAEGPLPGYVRGDVGETALAYSGNLNGWKIYLAGNAGFVHPLIEKTVAMGAEQNDIFVHTFAYRNLRLNDRSEVFQSYSR